MIQLPEPLFSLDSTDPKGRLYVLKADFHFEVSELFGWSIVVPAGFKTDFATLPPLTQFIVTRMGYLHIVTLAAIIHDYLYAVHGVSRAVADGIFREILGRYGAPRSLAKVLELVVRVFGWRPYQTGPARLARNCPGLTVKTGTAPTYEGVK